MKTKDFVLFDADDHVAEPEKIEELKRQPTPLPGQELSLRLLEAGSQVTRRWRERDSNPRSSREGNSEVLQGIGDGGGIARSLDNSCKRVRPWRQIRSTALAADRGTSAVYRPPSTPRERTRRAEPRRQ
jgi:hypothetical protein